MITFTRSEEPAYWTSGNVRVVVDAVWNPNEEQDPWVKFHNIETQQEYTCRLEAFQARYSPHLGQ